MNERRFSLRDEVSGRVTGQRQRDPERWAEQVQNEEGGWVFPADKWQRLLRFLVLGTENGTYYVGPMQLTKENLTNVVDCWDEDPDRTADTIVTMTTSGRTFRKDPAIAALAYGAGRDLRSRVAALEAMLKVCTTGSDLLMFVEMVRGRRGWGRTLRDAVAAWYNMRTPDQLQYQLAKYGHRNKWTQKGVLQHAHPVPASKEHDVLYRWATQGLGENLDIRDLEPFPTVYGRELLRLPGSKNVPEIVRRYRLPWEVVPTDYLANKEVLAALLTTGMPYRAMLRYLSRMEHYGVFDDDECYQYLVRQLTSIERISKSKIHPMDFFIAWHAYRRGRSNMSNMSWDVRQNTVDLLADGFELAFRTDADETSDKRILVAVDCSGSMSTGLARLEGFTASQVGAVLALVILRQNPRAEHVWFDTSVHTERTIGQLNTMTQAITRAYAGGGTDCASPILWAMKGEPAYDGFVIITDGETWAGEKHVFRALESYRMAYNPRARCVVVAMTASRTTFLDPKDALSCEVAGFDTNVPRLVQLVMRDELLALPEPQKAEALLPEGETEGETE